MPCSFFSTFFFVLEMNKKELFFSVSKVCFVLHDLCFNPSKLFQPFFLPKKSQLSAYNFGVIYIGRAVFKSLSPL